MKKVTFCFGIHNHQPVGNFDWVVKDAFERSYLPFLQTLERFPTVRISLHFTGILYDWMRDNLPEVDDAIRRLIAANQVELLTGGHYEPIMPIISDCDKLGQIEKQSKYIYEQFGVEPQGMWLAERVWEPHLPMILAQAGVKYTLLDDIHFLYAGLKESDLNGYYLTEEQGHTLALFPIARELRYAIPFEDPEKVIEILGRMASDEGDNIAIYGDDGEKFGVWPETYELCFERKWLERFFTLLSENSNWIEMKLFSEVLKSSKPVGRVYLPTASYVEMNEWAMPAEAIERYEEFADELKSSGLLERYGNFVKGGFWRNFLSKYEESNHIHKRMLYISDLVAKAKREQPDLDLSEATDHLYAGQCNCPYWHGVFGGLYLPHLRGAIYQELVRAESSLRRATGGKSKSPEIEITDFNCDGSDEVLVTTNKFKAVISPANGGVIHELDSFDTGKNLVDIVGRRREGYHHKLLKIREQSEEPASIHDRVVAKEEGLEKLLTTDWYRRGLFIDHFLGAEATLESFARSRYLEDGDFVNQPYEFEHNLKKNKLHLKLQRDGSVWHQGERAAIAVCKELLFTTRKESLTVNYEITSRHNQPVELHFGVEFGLGSFTFPPGESTLLADSGTALGLETATSSEDLAHIELASRLYNFKVSIAPDRKADFWCHPLWTVSLSEGGFEKVHQGLIIMPHWRLRLKPGESWRVAIDFSTAKSESVRKNSAAVVSGQAQH